MQCAARKPRVQAARDAARDVVAAEAAVRVAEVREQQLRAQHVHPLRDVHAVDGRRARRRRLRVRARQLREVEQRHADAARRRARRAVGRRDERHLWTGARGPRARTVGERRIGAQGMDKGRVGIGVSAA